MEKEAKNTKKKSKAATERARLAAVAAQAPRDRQRAFIVNAACGYLAKDLLHLMDRQHVFEIVKTHVLRVRGSQESFPLHWRLAFDYMDIVCAHDWFLALNLDAKSSETSPKMRPQTPLRTHLKAWRDCHFLVGTLLLLLHKIAILPKMRVQFQRGIGVIRSIVFRHMLVAPAMRLSRGAGAADVLHGQQRIAALLFPYVLLVIDHGQSIARWSRDQRRSALLPLLEIVYRVPGSDLEHWWEVDSEKRRVGLFLALQATADAFEYCGLRKLAQRKKLNALEAESAKRVGLAKNNLVEDTSNVESSAEKPWSASACEFWAPPPVNYTAEMLLCSHVGATVSAASARIAALPQIRHTLCGADASHFADSALGTIAVNLGRNVPVDLSQATLNLCSAVTVRFAPALFRRPSVIVGELAAQALYFMEWDDCPSQAIRDAAASLLCALFISNLKETRDVNRMRLQCTIAITTLAGERDAPRTVHLADGAAVEYCGVMPSDFASLKVAVGVVKEAVPGNVSAVGAAVQRLAEMMEYQTRIRAAEWDPERACELIYTLARSFEDSPDLKVAWLYNLTLTQQRLNNWEEAVQALVLGAAHIAEYLRLLDRWPAHMKTTQFVELFPNLRTELSCPDRKAMLAMQADACQSKAFNEEGFVRMLLTALSVLENGQLYESCVDVYKLLLPVHECRRDYKAQADCHGSMAALCAKILKEEEASQRIFSNYYLVAFFGAPFRGGEAPLDGKKFVYRENNSVRIAELSATLKKRYSDRYGADKIAVINTKTVKLDQLDLEKLGYVQIIAVDAYVKSAGVNEDDDDSDDEDDKDGEESRRLVGSAAFGDDDDDDDDDDFDLNIGGSSSSASNLGNGSISSRGNGGGSGEGEVEARQRKKRNRRLHVTNIARFVFESPFLVAGFSEEDVAGVSKRKTILKTANTLPFVEKRVEVIKTSTRELRPIDAAFEQISKQADDLSAELDIPEPRANVLQMALQGSLLLQVNAGPLAVCNAFLNAKTRTQYDPHSVQRLSAALLRFSRVLQRAVHVNASLVTDQQAELQKMLEEGLEKFVLVVKQYGSELSNENVGDD